MTHCPPRLKRRGRRRNLLSFQPFGLESLENRLVLSAVAWTGPNGGAWDVGSNWSTGSVPGQGDDVTIDTASAATITIQSGDGVSVNSLATGANDTLSFSGGSLSVSASSTLSGPLTMIGGTLTATGSGADLIANGSTSISGASLFAENGGSLSLPQLTSYSSNGGTFEAHGPGSELDLHSLTALTQTGSLSIFATDGGDINLSDLSSLTSTSLLNLTDTGGSRITDPRLTSFQGVNVWLDGTDADVANSWTKFTGGTLHIEANSYTLPNLTDVDQSSLYVTGGGYLALPGLTSYATNGFFSADGLDSVLDVRALATMTQVGNWEILATHGGRINLSSLSALEVGHVGQTQNYEATIADTGNSTILDNHLTSLVGVLVESDGTDNQVANSWATFTNGSLNVFSGVCNLPVLTQFNGYVEVSGGTCNLPAVTDFDGSSVYVTNGGKVTLAGLTSYASVGVLSVDGAGSVLDLPALTTVNETAGWNLISATHGAAVEFPRLNSLANSGAFAVSITDAGGSTVVDGMLTSLSDVTVTVDGTDPHMADSWESFVGGQLKLTGGTFSLPRLTDIDGSSLDVTGGGTLTLPALTDYDAGATFNPSTFESDGTGSTLDLPALANVTAQSGGWVVEVTGGGLIELMGLTSLANTGANLLNVTFTGQGTILDNNLTSLSGIAVTLDGPETQVGSAWENFLNGTIYVTTGTHDLPSLADFDGSSVFVTGGQLALPKLTSYGATDFANLQASGSGSVLDLSALTTVGVQASLNIGAVNGGRIDLSRLTSLTGNYQSAFIEVTDIGGSTIVDPDLVSSSGATFFLDGTDPHVADSLSSVTHGGVTVSGGTYSLPNLIDVDGSQLAATNGGSLTLPGLTGPASNLAFFVQGTGSTVDASALSGLVSGSYLRVDVVDGANVKLSGLTALDNLSSVEMTDNGGSTVVDDHVTSLSNANVITDGTDQHLADTWTQFTDGSLTVTGGACDWSNLRSIDGSSLSVQKGASLSLPGVTSYTSNGAAFEASGQGTALDMSALTTATPTYSWHIGAVSGGDIKLNSLTTLAGAPGVYISGEGSNSRVELPGLTSFSGPNTSVTVGDGGSIVLGSQTLTMPAPGNGLAVTVPALPFNVSVNLTSTGTFSGGTTFDIGQGDIVNITGGIYTGGATFNVPQTATVDLTGGDLVDYSGTLTSTGGGTVELARGGVVVGPGGLTLDFPLGTFQWTGGEFYPSGAQVSNAGDVSVGTGATVASAADFTNAGTLTVPAGSKLDFGGNFTQTPGGTLNVEIASTPESGQFGRLAVQNAATLDGTLKVTLSGGFVPQDNEDFRLMTFGSASGNFADIAGLSPYLHERVQPTSLDVVTTLHDTIDSPQGVTLNATEGATFNGVLASFSDANPLSQASDFAATINWGDGTTTAASISAAGGGRFDVSGSHAYAEDGSDTLTISISGVGGATATIESQANVSEASTAASGVTLTAGQATALVGAVVASFTHGAGLEAASEFAATIDWGDGQTSSGTIAESKGTYSVIGSHTYAQSGTFTVRATVTDDGIASVVDSSVIVLSTDAMHRNYVAAVYENVLGRAPDVSGLAYWTNLLDQGAAVSSVAEAIAHSDEYYANFVIKPDYLNLLGRSADDAGVKYWTSRMDAGLTDQQLEASLVSSDEFFVAAGGTNAAWINTLYKLLLGRAADPGGVNYWLDQLSAGATRSDVATKIAGSQENDTQLIQDDYFHYLGRPADDAGIAYWLAQFAAGESNEEIIAGFTGSAEYYKEHAI